MITTDIDTDRVVRLALADLHPAEDNPRQHLGGLDELAESIRSLGILQPLVVVERTIGGGYTIVAGHRRHAAAALAEIVNVPCIVREFTVEERQLVMLVENLQRQDLDPLDEARGFQHLTDLGLSQRAIAERVGCNQSHVSRRLTLSRLPDKAVELLRAGTLQLRQAEQLAALPDDDVDDVVGKLAEIDGAIDHWRVDQAIKKVADDRKRATAIAAAEATKTKRLKKDPRYDYAWQVCKKTEATHWFIDDYGGTTVHWVRKKPKDDGPAKPSAYELERQTREAGERQRIGQLIALLDRDESIVLELGLGYLVDKVCGNGWHARITLDGTELHDALTDTMIADLTDDRPLFVAVATLVGIADRAIEGTHRFEGDDDIEALWARIADIAGADVGLPDATGISEAERDELLAAIDADEVDDAPPYDPDDVVADEMEPISSLDDGDEFFGVDAAVATTPVKRPWATYDGNDVERICKMATGMTAAFGIQEILDYERANGGRAVIIEHCTTRLAELGA